MSAAGITGIDVSPCFVQHAAMSYTGLTYAELAARFSELRQAVIGDRRAPHKPLLVLLMLGRYQQGNYAPLKFAEAQTKLASLLAEFGPPARSTNVIDPFWRLQNDGVWRVESSTGGQIAETVAPPNVGTLIDEDARGNFVPEIAAALKSEPAYVTRLGRDLLAAHFPSSLHEDICAAVGLEPDSISDQLITQEQRARDTEFRPRIIRAYEYRCAVTGWDLRVGQIEVGLEAAHIKWHSAGGPSVESNGIALNSLHHKLFDLGAFTLSLGDAPPQILVSREVNGGDYARQLLIDLHRKPIRPPQDPIWLPDASFVKWHHEEVFKGPARA
ncbi:MAG: phosphorothioated DNA-binding restriction endonuclease [Nitrospirota bacterium]